MTSLADQTSDVNSEQGNDQLTFKVGERSYDAESAAVKISNGDTHITTLETEAQESRDKIASLEAKLSQSTQLDDALNRLKNPQQEPQESLSEPVTAGVSEERIGEIANKQIETLLAERKVQADQASSDALALQTFNETKEVLEKQYGDKVAEAIKAEAIKLNCTVEDIDSMAKNPIQAKLLLASMKVGVPANDATPSGSFNTASFSQQKQEGDPNWYKGSSNTIMQELQRRRQLS